MAFNEKVGKKKEWFLENCRNKVEMIYAIFNISLVLISILRSTINANSSKFHSFTKIWSLLIYKVSLRTIQ